MDWRLKLENMISISFLHSNIKFFFYCIFFLSLSSFSLFPVFLFFLFSSSFPSLFQSKRQYKGALHFCFMEDITNFHFLFSMWKNSYWNQESLFENKIIRNIKSGKSKSEASFGHVPLRVPFHRIKIY